jgi:hypothetical protein
LAVGLLRVIEPQPSMNLAPQSTQIVSRWSNTALFEHALLWIS